MCLLRHKFVEEQSHFPAHRWRYGSWQRFAIQSKILCELAITTCVPLETPRPRDFSLSGVLECNLNIHVASMFVLRSPHELCTAFCVQNTTAIQAPYNIYGYFATCLAKHHACSTPPRFLNVMVHPSLLLQVRPDPAGKLSFPQPEI